jgi:methylmalonyl-CoA/ethylmalonyl-CoA epimerase
VRSGVSAADDLPAGVLGPLGDVEIDHLGFAVYSIADQVPLYRRLLGGTFREGGDTHGDFRSVLFDLPGRVRVELLEPIDDAGKLAGFLRSRGAGLHHITVRCRDVEDAIARAAAAGYRIVGEDLTNPPWREAYIHPNDACGSLIQLFDSTEPRDRQCTFALEDVLDGQVTWSAGRYVATPGSELSRRTADTAP